MEIGLKKKNKIIYKYDIEFIIRHNFFKLFNLDDAGITIDSKDIMINEFFNNVNNYYDSIEFTLNLYDYDIIKNLLNFFYENDEIKKFILDIFNKSANLPEEDIKKLICSISIYYYLLILKLLMLLILITIMN